MDSIGHFLLKLQTLKKIVNMNKLILQERERERNQSFYTGMNSSLWLPLRERLELLLLSITQSYIQLLSGVEDKILTVIYELGVPQKSAQLTLC